jgi:alkanesulfonate monooxygenase SsuD/methylene tetrahydromethanopterin reductase-like flavin-dependent oxidoreductase (luciferase family)
VAKRVDHIDRIRDEDGQADDFQIYVLRHGFCAETEQAAWNHIEPGYRYLQRRYAEWYGEDSIGELPDERVRELREEAILGPPETIAAELEPYRNALGDDVHIILRTYFPGIGTKRMQTCIQRLGDEVAPVI